MILQLVQNDEQKHIVQRIISMYHSYVPTHRSVGRRIDWIVYDSDNFTILGMVGVGSSVYPPPKDILHHIGKTKEEYKKDFNSFANNWRFCMIVHRKNLGSQILKEFRKNAKIEWKKKYGDDLKYIITFVGDGHDGAVYKSDNWDFCGFTSGLNPAHKSVSMKWDSKEKLNKNFSKPTGENKKLIFIKKI